MGAPIASAATSICWPASALRNGSMSEEFSGQMTATGCACMPGGDLEGELLGGAHVVVQHGPALGVEVQAEPRDVALDDRDLLGRPVGAAPVGCAGQGTADHERADDAPRGAAPRADVRIAGHPTPPAAPCLPAPPRR